MTESKLLFTENSYIREFDAEVILSGPKFVVLNQTTFYPEGGGQPSDTGKFVVNGEDIEVLKVIKRGEMVFHYIDKDIKQGLWVKGIIDWNKRYRYMRLHSGEHLLTGLFEARDSGPKVFSSFEQLDFQPSEITEETIKKVWTNFDEIVEKNIPIEIYYINRDNLRVGEDLRKQSFLEKIPQSVQKLRIIRIGEYAETFCMGTHVRSTGEIGKIRDLHLKSKKKGKKIVYFKLEG